MSSTEYWILQISIYMVPIIFFCFQIMLYKITIYKYEKQLAKEYNAYTESKKRMKGFEEKYNISSFDFMNNNYETIIFEDSDKYLWETYIRDFIRCGGKIEDKHNFNEFLKMNRDKIYNNTPKNPTISKDDEWRNEDFWEESKEGSLE